MNLTALLFVVAGTPLGPVSFPFCLVDREEDADVVAREVQTLKEADWCVVIAPSCRDAFSLYRDQTAKVTYVVNGPCRR